MGFEPPPDIRREADVVGVRFREALQDVDEPFWCRHAHDRINTRAVLNASEDWVLRSLARTCCDFCGRITKSGVARMVTSVACQEVRLLVPERQPLECGQLARQPEPH